MCYECRKNRIRQIHKERSDSMFPTLDPSEDNLTTASIVKKYLPGLSYPEIEIKIARGEIARPGFRLQHSKTVEFSDEEEDVKPRVTNKKVTIADNNKKTIPESRFKTNELFFTNIRDLNNKIITGTVDRNSGFVKSKSKLNLKKNVLEPFKSHYPSFVSPRKVKLVTETKYKTFFEPPLIEKAKQDVEPAFFAGSTGEYQLPEKLPDELVFIDKDGNEVKASDSEGFTAKMSASVEAGDKRKHDLGDKPPISADLSALKEDEEEEGEDSDSPRLNKTESEEESKGTSTTPTEVSSPESIESPPEKRKPSISTVKARTVNKTL